MRLSMLLILRFALCVPVPVMVWRDILASQPVSQYCDSTCTLLAPETFMPAMQEQPFPKAEQIEKKNAERRQQREAGKHVGNLKPVARFNNTPRQAGAGA